MAAAQALPDGWTVAVPDSDDVAELTDLLRRHEQAARGWASASPADVRMEVAPGNPSTRRHLMARDPDGVVRGWGSAHGRAAGRVLLVVGVDPGLTEEVAHQVADALFGWAHGVAGEVAGDRGIAVQQLDSGA